MDTNKDYYAVLGVLPTAEDAVIRAAYRALAQRYHPDRNPGSDTAKVKMQELNEAYAVLSDPETRNEYDALRSKGDGSDYENFYEEKSSTTSDDPIWADWEKAIEYHPELNEILNDLSKVSSKLAYSFQAYLVEERAFSQAKTIAKVMQDDFLHVYFGENRRIKEFGLMLILGRHREAARELNRVANLFGTGIDANRVINNIRSAFKIGIELDQAAERGEGWPAPTPGSDARDKFWSHWMWWVVVAAGILTLYVFKS